MVDPEKDRLKKKVSELEKENENLKSRLLSLEMIKSDARKCQLYTGMPNYGTFLGENHSHLLHQAINIFHRINLFQNTFRGDIKISCRQAQTLANGEYLEPSAYLLSC